MKRSGEDEAELTVEIDSRLERGEIWGVEEEGEIGRRIWEEGGSGVEIRDEESR